MPSITVHRPVTLSEAASALQERLGGSYKITPHGGGSRETIGITHAGQLAGVRLVHNDDSTTFRVHGRGVLIGLAVNELVIARRVSKALAEALNSTTPS